MELRWADPSGTAAPEPLLPQGCTACATASTEGLDTVPCSQGRDVPASGACSAPSINCLPPLINCRPCTSPQVPAVHPSGLVLHLQPGSSISTLTPARLEGLPGSFPVCQRPPMEADISRTRRGLSTLPVSGFYRERPWFWPCQLFTMQQLQRCPPRGPRSPCSQAASTQRAHAQPHTAGPALGCRNIPTSPPRVGLSASRPLLGQHEAAVPLCRGFGSGWWLTHVPAPDLSQSEATCAHCAVVAGTATTGSSTEWRRKQLPPQAAISASAPASEG